MIRILFMLTACLAASGQEGFVPVSSSPVDSRVHYKLPRGWNKELGSVGRDEFISFTSDRFTIRVQRLGGKDSRHADIQHFLDSLEAKSEGAEPEVIGHVRVAGHRLKLYRRMRHVAPDDPHVQEGAMDSVREDFCVLPDGRGEFFVLTYSGPEGKLAKTADKAWKSFLSSFKLAAS